MKLLYDDYNAVWVWVETNDHNIELSPRFDEEEDAKFWMSRIINIVKKNDIQ